MIHQKLHLANVSLVCIETRYPKLAQYAIDRCLAEASFKECLLLSSVKHALPDYIEQVSIPPIESIEAYSEFMLRDLGQYFSGDHVLIMQWDSFILRGDLWTDEFLEYDYIGAPWPHRPVAVGNGGFSIRSRRLVDALSAITIDRVHPEDFVICELHREELINNHKIRFAPTSLATRFAFEGIQPTSPSFGFHGFFNFHRGLNDIELAYYLTLCDTATLQSEPAQRLVKNLFRSGRYKMAEHILKKHHVWTMAQILDTVAFYMRIRLHAFTHLFIKKN